MTRPALDRVRRERSGLERLTLKASSAQLAHVPVISRGEKQLILKTAAKNSPATLTGSSARMTVRAPFCTGAAAPGSEASPGRPGGACFSSASPLLSDTGLPGGDDRPAGAASRSHVSPTNTP
jgi:hypothetical protein